jgi:hypothetical protein
LGAVGVKKYWTMLVEKLRSREEIIMRVILIVVFVFVFFLALTNGYSGDLKDLGRTSRDVIRPGRSNILDEDGDRAFYIERDRLNPKRFIIYDDDAEEVGVVEPDPIRPREYLIRGDKNIFDGN